jgi:hypothetical protein
VLSLIDQPPLTESRAERLLEKFDDLHALVLRHTRHELPEARRVRWQEHNGEGVPLRERLLRVVVLDDRDLAGPDLVCYDLEAGALKPSVLTLPPGYLGWKDPHHEWG